ncbi:hypothetical protein [Streptomyces sp. Ncost-T10-10d]|uniref:hypothetical protein n=1 Tax=Streptomyces sp. Ncost-T10-10d TaxID=1839774 RepID=UPI00081E85AB|nr:hypothetical protein GA0115254_1248168 [Streptomyces sp. Ncost-T10-10d]
MSRASSAPLWWRPSRGTTALGVHISAASVVLLTAVMLLTERHAEDSVQRPAGA